MMLLLRLESTGRLETRARTYKYLFFKINRNADRQPETYYLEEGETRRPDHATVEGATPGVNKDQQTPTR